MFTAKFIRVIEINYISTHQYGFRNSERLQKNYLTFCNETMPFCRNSSYNFNIA